MGPDTGKIKNELSHLPNGTVKWVMDPNTYRQVSALVACGTASITIAGGIVGGVIGYYGYKWLNGDYKESPAEE